MTNRIFKFRAWNKAGKKMIYFKPGFVWEDEYHTWSLSADGEDPASIPFPPDDNIKFMQFTGLLDKDDKEIYEGDILQLGQNARKAYDFPDSDGSRVAEFQQVGFKDGCFMTGRKVGFPEHLNTYLWILPPSEIKVVGNIYEGKRP